VARFQPVDPKVDFPALEARILRWWREARVFEQSVKLREGSPAWIFYEGPPTANGKPGIHHVEARTYKDVYPRYRTMTGHYVVRKAGWDCHGLPVELEVEKEIGTTSKRDIEEFGIAEFNRRCRESVTRYVDEWARMTERIGFWIDLSDAYWTMNTEYVESVWWSLKRLYEQGLLEEDYRTVAYCPRCGTGLSDAEVALGYAQVSDPSVYVKFRVTEPSTPELEGVSILAWTTTPWTLPSNEGLAVAPDESYAIVDADGDRLVIANALKGTVLSDAVVVGTLVGSALVGTRYEPLYPNVDGNAHRVVAADFVAMNEGTGVVHIAPGYGAEDLELGRREGWPPFNPTDDRGRFTDQGPEFVRGMFVKDADPLIVEDLRARELLLRAETYEHTYPLCWRCDTPLLYVARTSWYIRTTARKDRLLAVNDSVNWYPPSIKHGRYGDWLANNVDWALSRERYWGTPLPLWRCEREHVTAVGSLRELSELAGRDVTGIDPHRPTVDDVEISCRDCGERARRVPEVIDTWFDSGAMPYAQWGYHPDLGRGIAEFERSFPADFISEAIDQTRGWFYSLMAESTLLFDDTAYRNVVCLGLLVDRDGRKMSKRLGNIIDPWTVLERQGADALRWFFLTSGSPWADRRIFPEAIDEVVRRFLLTLWNVHSFFTTYAAIDGFDPSDGAGADRSERPPLDRWILSQLAATIAEARRGLDAYDATGAGRRIERFVDDLSNWYVRRARRRFWDPARGGASDDKRAAYATLYGCLVTVAKLLAPFTPFVAEELWRGLSAGHEGEPESVHLADYPAPDPHAIDRRLDAAMEAIRDLAAIGRQVRLDNRIRTRQPLASAVVHYAGDEAALVPLLSLLEAELNVKQIQLSESSGSVIQWRARPNFRSLGPKLGPRVKDVAAALARDDGEAAARLAAGEKVTLSLDDGAVELSPDDVDLSQQPRAGWGAVSRGHVTLALDLEISPALRREGLAREVMRVVQDARKNAGLDVSDRIVLGLDATDELADAIETHREEIAGETLAVDVQTAPPAGATHREDAVIDGMRLTVSIAKRSA
jgi:isoleucyl-tRNA synthetase